MSLVWANTGLNEIARYVAGLQHDPFRQRVRLFTNDVTPDASTVVADLTECTLAGYTPLVLENYTFTGGITSVVEYHLPVLFFTFSAYAGPPVTIYGAYSTNIANTLLWWTKLRLTPYTVPLIGGAYGIGIVHRLGQLN